MTAGKRYTDEQRREVLQAADVMGDAYAAAEFDVKRATLRKWRERLKWQPSRERIERLAAGNAAQVLEWEQRRITMAHELGELADVALKRAKAELDAGTPHGLQNAVTASVVVARAVDKAQLLTGAPTSRTEDVGARERANELLERLVSQSQGPSGT